MVIHRIAKRWLDEFEIGRKVYLSLATKEMANMNAEDVKSYEPFIIIDYPKKFAFGNDIVYYVQISRSDPEAKVYNLRVLWINRSKGKIHLDTDKYKLS